MLSLFVPFLSECQNFRRSDIKLFSNYAMIFIEKAGLTLAEMDTGCVLHVFESELCPIRSGISPKIKY